VDNHLRIVSVSEARELLPLVIHELFRLQELHEKFHHAYDELVNLSKTSTDVHEISRARMVADSFDEATYRIIQDLQSRGVVVRDIQVGLIDFLSERDGEPVWLCYRLGEKELSYYHELHSGFYARRPIDF
jgi:hypothetical protein